MRGYGALDASDAAADEEEDQNSSNEGGSNEGGLQDGSPLERHEAWRWLSFASYALNAALNNFSFADFTSAATQARTLFDVTATKLEWHYSLAFITIVPCCVPAAYWLAYDLPSCHLALASANAAMAWIRYWAATTRSYTLCLVPA